MTQEDKELLLKDLSAKLSYGVKVHGIFLNYNKDKDKILYEECDKELNYKDLNRYESLKPYLRQISSMTEEELKEFKSILNYDGTCDCFLIALKVGKIIDTNFALLVDWLNKNMFDYRGLILKGLALEAPEGMYKS